MHSSSKSRNPAGVTKGKPIALRLMPSEKAEAKRIAARLGTSQSALARKAYLAGLPCVIGKEA